MPVRWLWAAGSWYFHRVHPSLSSTAVIGPSPQVSQTPPCARGALTSRPRRSAELSSWPGGGSDAVPAVWHLLIWEEFAWRAGLGQLAGRILRCNRDAAGWHGLGPSAGASVFGSSKSSALLEQRGIQDADPTEDEKATGSQTSCPAVPASLPPPCQGGHFAETVIGSGDGGWGQGCEVGGADL